MAPLERIGRNYDQPVSRSLLERRLTEVSDRLRQLREDPATASIPVVAVTASVMASDRREITDAGFDGYIGKPINLKEFVETVRRSVEGRAT